MTPQKAKDKIKEIAEGLGLEDVITRHGVDRIWKLMLEEINDDIFTGLEEICEGVLIKLNKS